VRNRNKKAETVNVVGKDRVFFMFGSGKKKTQYVKLTEKEIKELEKNMSRSELKKFRKRQKQAKNDLMWDTLMAAEFLDDDLFDQFLEPPLRIN
jgi:hypothetical protein